MEDEPLIRELLQQALEDGGFMAQLAGNGTDAIAALEAIDADYRALITDIRMGRGLPTGWDVAKRARELNATLPVIYVTGDAEADWLANGVPGSVVISKPFAPAQIVTGVAQLINASDTVT